jgi:poly(A) polymerase
VLETHVASPMLRLADRLGLLDVLIPELIPAKGCVQPKEHYYDVFNHLVETVTVLDAVLGPEPAAPPWSERYHVLWGSIPEAATVRSRYTEAVAEGRTYGGLLKLAGLLHDVSKPETRAVQPNGRVRFFGHDDLGARKAAQIMERLRYTSREIRLVELLIKDHLRPGQLSSGRSLPTRRALYRFYRDQGDAVPDLLLLNLADHAAARGPSLPEDAWAGHVAYIAWILAQGAQDEALVKPPRLVTGNDLMVELNLQPGPQIGRLLEELNEAQAVGRVRTREQALKLARRLALTWALV